MKILIFISFLFIPAFSSAQNVSGNVKDFHFNNPLEIVSVTLKNNSSGEIVGTDSTDASGNYSIDYVIVSVNQINNLPDDYNLSNAYPNPFNPSTRIDFSAPLQGKFTARIYNILGQLVYSKDFTIDAGNYSFNISELGSAGVYLFNLSSDDFTSTQKLLLLDGGSGNITVELTVSNTGRVNKPAYEDLLIEFRKDGYAPYDTVVAWQMNLIVDAELEQIPQPGIAIYTGHITTEPGGGNGIDLDVHLTNTENDTTLAQVVSNGLGNWNASFPFVYRTNGVDSTYNIQGVNINISGTGVNPVNKTVEPFAKQYNWDAIVNLITQFITAEYNLHVSNLQTGENVPDAVDAVRDQNNNLLFTISTNANGNASKTYQNGYTVNGNDTLWTITQLNSTLSKTGYNTLQFSNPFQETLNLEKELENQGQVNQWNIEPRDIDGNLISNLTYRYFTNDGIKEFSVNQTSGKIEVNWIDYHDIKQTEAQLVHLNTNEFDDVFVGVKASPTLVNSDYLYSNSTTSIGGVADTTLINIVLQNANPNQEAYFIPQAWNTESHGDFTWDGSVEGNEIKQIILAFGHPGHNKPIGDFNGNYNGVAQMDHFLFMKEFYTQHKISSQDSINMVLMSYDIASNDTLPHGKILGKTYIYAVDDPSTDPNYQNAQSRGSRFGITQKKNDPTPSHITLFDPSDPNRINGFLAYTAENSGTNTLLTETWEALIGGDDFTISGGSGQYIQNPSNIGKLNMSGKRIYIIGKLFPKNTIF